MVRAKPPPPVTSPPPRPQRLRRGKGRRYVADVVEQVRVLIVGTTWPEAEIARRVGIGVGTVHGWKMRRKWQRPPGVSLSTRKVATSRAGLTRRCREGLRQLEDMASGEVLRLSGQGDPKKLSRAVALVVQTRNVLRPSRPRHSLQRLEQLATGEAERLGGAETVDPVALEWARALAAIARRKLYRRSWRPPVVEPVEP